MIHIINYGLGNLGSIKNMLKRIGFQSEIIDRPHQLEDATKIILPGIGAFDSGMRHLLDGGWIDTLNRKVIQEKVPALGICLGMQLMCRGSEEGKIEGLNWVDADVKRFIFDDPNFKIPHMGWNYVTACKSSKLFNDDLAEKRFYFVHSFYVSVDNERDKLFESEYGFKFTSAFEIDNIVGMQFHPEKSHKFGLSILKNFALNY